MNSTLSKPYGYKLAISYRNITKLLFRKTANFLINHNSTYWIASNSLADNKHPIKPHQYTCTCSCENMAISNFFYLIFRGDSPINMREVHIIAANLHVYKHMFIA